MCPMWDNDIIYGGEQLEPSVRLTTKDREHPDGDVFEYVLWGCDVVAENVATSLGNDGTKVEVIISAVRDTERFISDPPASYGTFASSIVSKVRMKSEGDLPAVIVFRKIPPKDATKQDAFVMEFRRRWEGDPASPLPTITPVTGGSTGMIATQAPAPKIDVESGRYYTVTAGRRVLGDKVPKAELAAAKAAEDAAIKDLT